MNRVDEVVKALRKAVNIDYDVLLQAIELLEQFEIDKQILINDISLKDKEIDQLKANQVVRCGECCHCEHDQQGYYCKVGLKQYDLSDSDYCSFGER